MNTTENIEEEKNSNVINFSEIVDFFKLNDFNEWEHVTKEELAMLDDKELMIIPIFDEKPGTPIKYGDFLKEVDKEKEPLEEACTEIQDSNFEEEMSYFENLQRYEYEVISHMKFKGLFGEFNTDELKRKLNESAAKGFRLAGLTSFKLSAVTPLEGIVAVMEKEKKQ